MLISVKNTISFFLVRKSKQKQKQTSEKEKKKTERKRLGPQEQGARRVVPKQREQVNRRRRMHDENIFRGGSHLN